MTKVKVDIEIKEPIQPFKKGDMVKSDGLIVLVDQVRPALKIFSGMILWSDRSYNPFVYHNNWDIQEFHLTPKGFRVTLEQE